MLIFISIYNTVIHIIFKDLTRYLAFEALGFRYELSVFWNTAKDFTTIVCV